MLYFKLVVHYFTYVYSFANNIFTIYGTFHFTTQW